MILNMKKISFTLILACLCLLKSTAQNRATFDNFILAPGSYYDGADLSGGFLAGDAYFYNRYDTSYHFWASGFAYSNVKDDTTAGFGNEYAAATGGGVFGSSNYAVANAAGGDIVVGLRGFAPGHQVLGFYVTNSTFAYLSMKNGDAFAKKFGGPTGNDPDWFKLTVKGWSNGALTSDSVDAYLADFRFSNNSDDYILKTWKFVNLQSLGNVDSLSFSLSSSDNGSFGMNTPAYFCMDNFMTTDGATIVTSPVAQDDAVTTIYTDSVRVDILANDAVSSFLDGSLTIASGPQVTGATAYIDSSDNLVYIPAVGLRTTDTVVYSYCDELGTCTTAKVVVTINGPTNTAVAEVSKICMLLYPNPVTSVLHLKAADLISKVMISDLSGREVLSADIYSAQASFDVSMLSPGVYMIATYTAAGIHAEKLVKE